MLWNQSESRLQSWKPRSRSETMSWMTFSSATSSWRRVSTRSPTRKQPRKISLWNTLELLQTWWRPRTSSTCSLRQRCSTWLGDRSDPLVLIYGFVWISFKYAASSPPLLLDLPEVELEFLALEDVAVGATWLTRAIGRAHVWTLSLCKFELRFGMFL